MTDTTDVIAEDISFQAFEDDCQLLGNLLNDCLRHEVGNEFMEKVERARLLAQVFKLALSFSAHLSVSHSR
jgi:phosphoenolpyruvate carboxylase